MAGREHTPVFDLISASAAETERAGAAFAAQLPRNAVTFVAMYGDLGAGKTAFVRGMASILTPDASVSSPTYALVNEYRTAGTVLYHFDMYRITDEDDLLSLGFYDYFTPDRRTPTCVIAAEWCENIPYALPEVYYRVEIQKRDADSRRITVCRIGAAETDVR